MIREKFEMYAGLPLVNTFFEDCEIMQVVASVLVHRKTFDAKNILFSHATFDSLFHKEKVGMNLVSVLKEELQNAIGERVMIFMIYF